MTNSGRNHGKHDESISLSTAQPQTTRKRRQTQTMFTTPNSAVKDDKQQPSQQVKLQILQDVFLC
jgi:hypothetical protein